MPQIYLTQRRCAYSRRWLSCASNDGYSPWRHLCHHLMAITSSSSPGQYVSMWLHLAYVSTQILTDPNPSSTLYLVPLFFLGCVLCCLHTMSITNKISWFKKLSPVFESLLILSSRENDCPLYSFWSLGFSRKAYGITLVRASVRASHHIRISAHLILMIFCTKLHLVESKKNVPSRCLKKILVCPPGVFWP